MGSRLQRLFNLWLFFLSLVFGLNPETNTVFSSDVDPCQRAPCGAGRNASCINLNDTNRVCACLTGFDGDGDTFCSDINACVDFPCSTGETCQDLPAPAPHAATGRTCRVGEKENGTSWQAGSSWQAHNEWGSDFGIFFSHFILTWIYVVAIHLLSQAGAPTTKVLLYFIATAHAMVTPNFFWLSWIWFLDFSPISITPLNAYQNFAVQLFTPLLCLAQLAMTLLFHWFYVRFYRQSPPPAPFRLFFHPYLRTCLAICLFSYSMITSLCFQYLTCASAGVNQVVPMPAMDCHDPRYLRWRVLILLFLVFPVLGLPIAICRLLFTYLKVIRLYDPKTQRIRPGGEGEESTEEEAAAAEVVVARYGILFQTYVPERFYWELWAVSRRAIFLAVAHFLQLWPLFRSQMLVVVNLSILLLQIRHQPFQEQKLGNYLETFALIGLTLLSITNLSDTELSTIGQVVVTMIVLIWFFILLFAVVAQFLCEYVHGARGDKSGENSETADAELNLLVSAPPEADVEREAASEGSSPNPSAQATDGDSGHLLLLWHLLRIQIGAGMLTILLFTALELF